MKLFLFLLAAHVISDYLLYSVKISSMKRTENTYTRAKAVFFHCLLHFAVTALIMLPYSLAFRLKAAAYISLFHFFIDMAKVSSERFVYGRNAGAAMKRIDALTYMLGRRNGPGARFLDHNFKRWTALTVTDQLLHVAVMVSFVILWGTP